MQIIIDNNHIEIHKGETILEAARRSGIEIPSMCYAKDATHKSSCMVCSVKNKANGQILPSCTTIPVEGMEIESESDEVKQIRRMSLELLLSDHRADCEAPCSLVCPQGLDIEQMLYYYDNAQLTKACQLIKGAFNLPQLACEDCKVPCEKVCRRGTVDKSVAIREIIKEIVGKVDFTSVESTASIPIDKKKFQSKLGRFTDNEKQYLKATVSTPSSCLHCACSGKNDCKLRIYADSEGAKRTSFTISSEMQAMQRIQINNTMWFEPAKCIRCGLCVYNSTNGFTFKDRGFGMQVYLPEENKKNIQQELAALCPTGAIYLEKTNKNDTY